MIKVRKHLGALSVAAMGGDEEAARAIVTTAAALCSDVRGIAGCQPQLADKIAAERNSWPILCDNHPEFLARNLRWLNVLPLGEKSILKKPSRKSHSFTTAANEVARIALISLAMRGEELTVEAVVKEGERLEAKLPEKYQRLRKKGETWAAVKEVSPRGSTSFKSNVRARVRELLRDAAKKLFSLPPK